MPHPRFSSEEIERRAEAIYRQKLRALLDTNENHGKVVVIDIETGEYELDRDGLAASRRALDKHPGAALYGLRIGYDVVEEFSGFAPAAPAKP